jgi:hypothetical protein
MGLASLGFAGWAGAFIFRSSFVAVDGLRRFSLFDDAMISMRYAWNLTHGLGLVWNPGEQVEGYTNLLMVILMAVWTSVFDKSIAVLAVQLTGILVLLGGALFSFLSWRELEKGGEVQVLSGFAVLAFVGSLLYYPLNYWTLMGMETGLLTLLLMAGTFCLLVYLRTGRWVPIVAGAAIFGLAFLTRPDSAPIAILSIGSTTLLRVRPDRRRFLVTILAACAYLFFPVAQVVFRAFYYEGFVPLTYVLKMTGMPLNTRWANGLGFVGPFLRQTWWAFGLAVLGAALRPSARRLVLLIPPIVLIAVQIFIGGDVWVYWRLLAPSFPFLVLLSLAGWADVYRLGLPLVHRASVLRGLGRRMPASLPPGLCFLAALTSILAGLMADTLGDGSPGFGVAQRLIIGLGVLIAIGGTLAWKDPLPHLAGMAMMMITLLPLSRPFLREAVLYDLPYQVDNNRNHVNVAITINRLTTDQATVGVLWAGIIPYYTSRYAIDFLGKNDPYIAGLPADVTGAVAWGGMSSVPGHNKYDLRYSILTRQPTYVEGFQWGLQDLGYAFRQFYVEVSSPGPDPALLRGDPSVLWNNIPPDRLLFP